MPRIKKPHPAEIVAEIAMTDAIRSASHFLASIFVGRGRYEKQEAATVFAALQARAALKAQLGVSQTGMIYAIQHDGRAVFITDELIKKLFTAARAAR